MGTFRDYLSVYRGLSRDTRLLIYAGAVNSLPFGVIGVALPIYLKLLGYHESAIGAAFSVNGGVAVLLIVPFGILADRFGRKRMTILGGLVQASAMFLLLGAANPVLLYTSAVLSGVAEALFFSTVQALMADSTTQENRTAALGISFFATSAAAAIGAIGSATPDLLRGAGWSVESAYAPLFLATGLVLLASPLLIFWVSVAGTRKAAGGPLLPRRSGGIIVKMLATNLVIGLGAGLIVPIFSLWFFLKFGQTESFTGPLFAVGAALNAVAFLAAPVLARRFGFFRTVFALTASGTILLLLLAVSPWLALASVFFLARNSAMNMSWPVMSSFLLTVVDPSERSSASAVVGLSFRLPFAVSTAFGAAMMAQNVDLPLYVTTALYAVGAATFFVFFRRVEEPRPLAAAGPAT